MSWYSCIIVVRVVGGQVSPDQVQWMLVRAHNTGVSIARSATNMMAKSASLISLRRAEQ
jgi:hypothetical protein